MFPVICNGDYWNYNFGDNHFHGRGWDLRTTVSGLLRFTHRVMFNFSADLYCRALGNGAGLWGTEDSDELEGCQF